MKFILVTVLTLLFLNSCSTTPERQRRRRYSRQTQKSFEEIERQRTLERYRLMRARDWRRYKARQIKKKPERSKVRVYGKTAPDPTPAPKPEWSQDKIKDLHIEISQYLNYYCMKHRKSSRFDDREECQTYTQNVFQKCQEKHPRIVDRSQANCVKSALNLR